jgi:hypothetical protein
MPDIPLALGRLSNLREVVGTLSGAEDDLKDAFALIAELEEILRG